MVKPLKGVVFLLCFPCRSLGEFPGAPECPCISNTSEGYEALRSGLVSLGLGDLTRFFLKRFFTVLEDWLYMGKGDVIQWVYWDKLGELRSITCFFFPCFFFRMIYHLPLAEGFCWGFFSHPGPILQFRWWKSSWAQKMFILAGARSVWSCPHWGSDYGMVGCAAYDSDQSSAGCQSNTGSHCLNPWCWVDMTLGRLVEDIFMFFV